MNWRFFPLDIYGLWSTECKIFLWDVAQPALAYRVDLFTNFFLLPVYPGFHVKIHLTPTSLYKWFAHVITEQEEEKCEEIREEIDNHEWQGNRERNQAR